MKEFLAEIIRQFKLPFIIEEGDGKLCVAGNDIKFRRQFVVRSRRLGSVGFVCGDGHMAYMTSYLHGHLFPIYKIGDYILEGFINVTSFRPFMVVLLFETALRLHSRHAVFRMSSKKGIYYLVVKKPSKRVLPLCTHSGSVILKPETWCNFIRDLVAREFYGDGAGAW